MKQKTKDDALDHVVVVMFENRSFDNVLGRLYAPGEMASFEGCSAGTLAIRFRLGPSMEPIVDRFHTAYRPICTPWPDPGEELP